jgi:hypothetical protein
MTLKPIGALPTAASVTGTDLVSIAIGGVFYRTTVNGLLQGMTTATAGGKGLLSAADKIIIDALNTQVAALSAPPSTPIVASTTITIPQNRYHITLSGTTTITTVQGMVARKVYTFSYPAGAGLVFLGEAMQAGDILSAIDE